MSELISFCINTAKNERYHIELLFKSLYRNLIRRDHEILVYVENNKDTVEWLLTQKLLFPNLKILINPLPIPLGYARNINLMFEMATHPIVSYLQSDMAVCSSYDLEILKHLDENTIISATRIEPPLHPPSPEKITYDFGLDPQKFNLDEFSEFAKNCKKDKITDFFFAPFTLYKKNWNSIGGHDTLFRRSREDSDLLYRFSMNGIKIKQVWNAIVYHFTCTSSRGIEWWLEKNQQRTKLQQIADQIEMGRFLRKWPNFKHTTTFNPEKEYKYPVSVNFTNVTPHNGDTILQNYYRFDHIYIDNKNVRENLKLQYDSFHNPANSLLDISTENWDKYKKYYRTWEFEDIFVSSPIIADDNILNIDPQSMDVFTESSIIQINDILHEHQDGPGIYSCGTGNLTINKFPISNKIKENIIVKNPPLDFELQIL